MNGYKNPALSLEKGILTGHCIVCGEYIGNEYDTNFYSLIRRKYCKKHSQEFDEITTALSRKKYKQKMKRTVKDMGKCIDRYKVIIYKQDEIIKALQRRLDDLERKVEI